MYAIEIFLFALLVGMVVIVKLCSYFIAAYSAESQDTHSGLTAEQLLDMYEKIYTDRGDDQMHRLVQWRELALQNCKARRNSMKEVKRSEGVSFIEDYRPVVHATSKRH